jgi:hypothetical protein
MRVFLKRMGIAAFLAAAVASMQTTSFAATPQQTALQAMVGHWTCVTHGSDGKTWHEADTYSMWGPWLKDDATYPAQNGQAAATGIGVLGYDAKHHRWYSDGEDTNGQYGSGYSNSSSLGGSKWLDGFPNNNGAGTLSLSKNQYVYDGKGPNDKGKMITSHQVCTRS